MAENLRGTEENDDGGALRSAGAPGGRRGNAEHGTGADGDPLHGTQSSDAHGQTGGGGCRTVPEAPRRLPRQKVAASDGIHVPGKSRVPVLPEDRKAEGLFLRLTVKSNIVQVNLKSISRGGVIRRRLETATAQAQIEALRIATPSPDKLVYELSGGNQQKVVVAKWLLTKSRIFIFDEPTRGIDVGAKQEIYQIIQQLAEQGASVLIISSDMPELIGLSDRIYTMKDGEITGELNRAERPFQQEEILRLILEGRK